MMDIEKLIEQLRWWADNCDRTNYGCQARPFLLDAATALSTLQAENEKLRADIVRFNDLLASYQNVLVPELRVENENLKERIEDTRLEWYAKGFGEVIAEVKRVRAELEQAKRDRDAIEQDFRAFAKQWWEEDSGFPCRWCKFERQGGCEWKVKHPGEICAGRAFEWRGKKEG